MRQLTIGGLCLLVAACGTEPRESRGTATLMDTLAPLSTTEIGVLDGVPAYLFGDIVGVTRDSEGVIYVADRIGESVRAYDGDGVYLGTVGSEGDGPGEFRRLLHVIVDADDQLVVRGAFRLSAFERSSGSQFADSVVRTVRAEGGRTDRDVPGRVSDSVYYSPGYEWEGFMRRGYYYEVYDRVEGTIVDTLAVPPLADPESTGRANYMVTEQGGMNVDGINRAPFEARPSWDITSEGRVWFAEGERYEVFEVGPTGDTLRVVRRDVPEHRVPDAERRDSLAAFSQRLDSLPVPLDRVRGMSAMARERTTSPIFPAITNVRIGASGLLWVRRWSPSAQTTYDVFDSSGLVRVVTLPVRFESKPAPWLSLEVVAGVAVDAETGVERVVVLHLGGP